MDTADDAAALYDGAMELSRAAFAGRHYAVAFHTLAAAAHAAMDLGDDARLATVERVVAEQGAWLDDREPGHELSSQSAAARGSRGLWATLRDEVWIRRHVLAARGLLRRMRPASGADEERGEGDDGGAV